jgi:hypothetical protein
MAAGSSPRGRLAPVRWRLGRHTIAIVADIGVEIVVVEAAGQTEPTGRSLTQQMQIL